jgi:hypothetical protein
MSINAQPSVSEAETIQQNIPEKTHKWESLVPDGAVNTSIILTIHPQT